MIESKAEFIDYVAEMIINWINQLMSSEMSNDELMV